MRNRNPVHVIAMALVFALCAVAAPGAAQAQNAVVTGRVTAETGQAIETANVFIPGMSISVSTNANGEYTINIPAARVQGQQVDVRVRAFGYQPQARPIRVTAGSQTVNFSMRQDVNRLSEIVVTGVSVGTERAKLPFEVAKVDASDIPVPTINPLTAIQGRVAGVNIVSASGRPGTAPEVLLRAPTSINASDRGQNPLYVVDGIIMAAGLPDLNSLDIEAIEVVKGAAATSLYGARAGNGLIQITTKRGSRAGDNQLRFGVRSEYGVSDIENEFELAQNHIYLMNADGSAFCANAACTTTFDWASEVLRLNSNSGALPLAPAYSPIQTGTSVWTRYQAGKWPGPTYNAIDQVVDPGNYAQVDGNMTGRFNQTSFFASIGGLRQEGSFIGLEGYRRGSARVNVDQNVGSDWNLQLSTYYSRSTDDGAGQEGNAFFDLTRMPRGVNLLMRDTVQNNVIIRPDLAAENENPAYNLLNLDRQDVRDRFLAGITTRYQPVTWFDLRSEASYDRRNNQFSQFNEKGFRTTRTSALNLGQVFKSSGAEQSINGALTGAVRRTFLGDMATSLSLRLQYEQQDYNSSDATGRDLAVKEVPDLDNARSPQIFVGSSESSVRRIGGFLNGTVDYKDRYFVDALLRRDGSSLFGSANRWQTFGRIGASWRPSQEPWFTVPGVDEMKLRAAVGNAGNSPRYSAQYETYTLSGGNFSPSTAGNKNLGPELLTEIEYGLDMTVLGRAGITLTYSDVTTKDQILLVPLPAASGFQFQWKNAGTLEGNTFEATLDIPWVRRADMTFRTRFTFDRSRATITELTVPPFQYGVNSQALEVAFYARKGERFGTIYGTKWATNCAQLVLPTGVDCSVFKTNDDGYLVWTGGADPASGVTQNPDGSYSTVAGTWGTAGPTVNGRTAMWGTVIPAIENGTSYLPLGNTLPNYRWSFSPTFTYKKFTATGLVDASQGRVVYNQGRQWSYFENYSRDQDQAGKPANQVKPVGYYGSTPGLYDVLQPNSHFVEDASFVKIREMTLSYGFGRVGAADWTVSLIGRNLKTFTDYKGWDPEVGFAGGDAGSGVINAFDAYRFPNLRTLTLALQASF